MYLELKAVNDGIRDRPELVLALHRIQTGHRIDLAQWTLKETARLLAPWDRPLFQHPLVDAEVYDELARRIAGGDGYPLPVFATNPFYPYFLAGFYTIAGPLVRPVVLFQLLLGTASAFLLYRIGRRIA